MDDLLMMFAAAFRERAAHCREKARTTMSIAAAEDLRAIAKRYENDAAQIEIHAPDWANRHVGLA